MISYVLITGHDEYFNTILPLYFTSLPSIHGFNCMISFKRVLMNSSGAVPVYTVAVDIEARLKKSLVVSLFNKGRYIGSASLTTLEDMILFKGYGYMYVYTR
mmetsp:Transcript_14261/g.21340  ORF Transcript_14261/g.21340 Transcript_14261/m.21340 type:complete len:102 (+) Transcript_14261:1097-1402(+)